MLSMLLVLLVFVGALVVGACLAWWVRSTSATCVLAVVGIVLLQPVVWYMPFSGFASEFLVFIAAVVLTAPMLAFVLKLKLRWPEPRDFELSFRKTSRLALIVTLVITVVGPGFVMPLSDRFRYAMEVGWATDGTIAEKYRDRFNHQSPTLVVRSAEGDRERFGEVDPAFFAAASVGDALHKEARHTHATLNGRSIAMVRPRFTWFGLAQAVAPD
jgi:hypothetical protein